MSRNAVYFINYFLLNSLTITLYSKRIIQMKKLFLFAFMIHSVSIFAQEESASGGIATVQFSATGINDMENQAFFNYFLQELDNASEDASKLKFFD